MKTIFVVDDSDTNLLMVEEALEDHYRVMTIPSAAKMFVFLEKITPDLILLDIEMPEMNGFEALQRLKSRPEYANVPVMFLTGYLDHAIEARSRELGAAEVIIKPFSAPALLERIGTYLSNS
ncbi:MAG: response regulator [Treponema sp.]|jgi:putative two-component system response regulator|nr:response regulator [Treponema sp.]